MTRPIVKSLTERRIVSDNGIHVAVIPPNKKTSIHQDLLIPALTAGCAQVGGSADVEPELDNSVVIDLLTRRMIVLLTEGDAENFVKNGSPRAASLKDAVKKYSDEQFNAAWAAAKAFKEAQISDETGKSDGDASQDDAGTEGSVAA